MTKNLLLLLIAIGLINAVIACGGGSEQPNQDLLINFDDPPGADLAAPLPPLATPIPTEPPPEDEPLPGAEQVNDKPAGTDTVARIESALTTIQFDITDLEGSVQDLRHDLENVKTQEDAEKEELLNEVKSELGNLTHQYVAELDRQVAELIELKLETQGTQYEETIQELRDSVDEYTQAYTEAIKIWPAPAVRFQPFMQTAIDRRQTQLEWVIQPYPSGLYLASFGEAFVFNMAADDVGKVVGLTRHDGAEDGRGRIPGFVPHQFPSEVYRSGQYIDVRYYKPNTDEETTLTNANGQGLHYRPRLPAHVQCEKITLFVSKWESETWSPWENHTDGCNPNGVNVETRYIVAIALDQQR